MAREDLRPSRIITRAAFENAIRVLMAIGGSTNAVVHLPAIAGRAGVPLAAGRLRPARRATTPMVANIRPSGKYQMEHLFEAGGIPAVMKELAPLLHLDAPTVTGRTLGADAGRRAAARRLAGRDHAPRPAASSAEGGLAILRGNLAPDGAVIKQSAATPALLRHRGPAVRLPRRSRTSRPASTIRPWTSRRTSVLVLQNAGPVGGPGMPEAGLAPDSEEAARGRASATWSASRTRG